MRQYYFLVSVCLFFNISFGQTSGLYVRDVENPVINLNGAWKICFDPPENYQTFEEEILTWSNIQVPGEVMMQGYPIKHDIPFIYKKSFTLPSDYRDHIIKLRFEGVYSYARVWVNGVFIREHHGGFTSWDCDITEAIKPDDSVSLILEVTDQADEISYASGYAKHQIGGILRDVSLLALPLSYPEDITVITDFDEKYEDAILKVSGHIKNPQQDIQVAITLNDPKNNIEIPLDYKNIQLNQADSFEFTNVIKKPAKWDAEHPNLYTLVISLRDKEEILWQKEYLIGFREIEIRGNKLFVNGKEIKLRGACRHDIHPLLGRLSTPEYDLKDVLLAKEANMNFIRTSHYPPSENFLDLCDKYGLYVEDETAVCFVGSHRIEEYRPGDSENDPEYTDRYLDQLAEMVSNHKNHPSVILWSIGNENEYGPNFKKSFDWVKDKDQTRPVIFSYPGKVPEGINAYEILSMHYPDTSGTMNQYGIKTKDFGFSQMPVIFDEWAHVACYNNFTVIEDPNIRDFWGRSLDMMWKKTFEADGALGGAIWGMIDETFMLPDSLPGYNEWWGKIDKNVIPAAYTGNTIGYGEWGIVDTWRRKKPEFWNTKKAYSPVRLIKTEMEYDVNGEKVSIPLFNRFDHTNIEELTIKLFYNEEERLITPPSIKPHTKGFIEFHMDNWEPELPVIVEFWGHDGELIDKYELRRKSIYPEVEITSSAGDIKVEETRDQLIVICNANVNIHFDKNTGLIQNVIKPVDTLTISGPYINLRTKGKAVMYSYHEVKDYGKDWALKKLTYKVYRDYAEFKIKGKSSKLSEVEFNIIIHSEGAVDIKYQIKNIPDEFVREIGVYFELGNIPDSLSWTRDPYWSNYPAGHLSARQGGALLYTSDIKHYRTKPEKAWNLDTKSFYYEGIEDEKPGKVLTYKAKATKENIFEYNLFKGNEKVLNVLSKGKHSCRMSKNNKKLVLYINNEMDYIDLSWGNYQRNIKLKKEYENSMRFSLH
jgi:hypothetical protein